LFLGNKGEQDCPGGVSIKDEILCRDACTSLGLPIKEIINGYVCYKDRRGHCYQNGQNGDGASMVCEKLSKFMFPTCLIKNKMGILKLN
jgi:hypothetical protein